MFKAFLKREYGIRPLLIKLTRTGGYLSILNIFTPGMKHSRSLLGYDSYGFGSNHWIKSRRIDFLYFAFFIEVGDR